MTLLLAALTPRSAAADCEVPPAEIVWSHPADGATDVPTDAVFFLVGTGIRRVELDGRTLERHVASGANVGVGYELGDLEPNTTYSLDVVLLARDGEEENQQTVTLTFQTGAGAHEGSLPPVKLRGISGADGWDHFSEMCQKVIRVQECYDEGQDTHVLLDVEGEGILYVVARRHDEHSSYLSSVAWPAACGDPSVFFYGDSRACYTVYALDETGRAVASQELCGSADEGADEVTSPEAGSPSEDTEEPPTDGSKPSKSSGKSSSGCSIVPSAGPSASWLLAALLPAYAVRRRRK